MQIRRRIKRSIFQYIIVAGISIVVIGLVAVIAAIMVIGQVKDEYRMQLDKVVEEIETNERMVYVAVSDIKRGEAFSEDNVELMKVFSSQPLEIFATGELAGKLALIDIAHGSHIMNNMISSDIVSTELREYECQAVYIGSNIANNDVVDIRLQYPNGESYIVLSKKTIKGTIPEVATCYLWVDEEELLRMSAAIVDAALYSGTTLYMTKYIEPNIQEASIVTYTPSLSVLSLIENNPNIVEQCSQELNKEIRKALENRLALNMDLDVSKINWNITTNDKYVKSAIKEDEGINEPIDYGQEDEGLEEDYLYYVEEEKGKAGDIEYGQ